MARTWFCAAVAVWGCWGSGAPAAGDVLLLNAGASTRELRCVVLDETDTGYRVRVKLGKSTIPKARVAGIQRHTAEENAALIARWDAAKSAGGSATPIEPVQDGPIPPPDRTETLQLDVNTLLQQYSLEQLQAGLDYDPRCPKGVDWCEARVRRVGSLHRTHFGLRKGDRVLGLNNQRFARGPAGDQQLQLAMVNALRGRRQTLNIVRGADRIDITYTTAPRQ